jgi:uncharacterized membrane protein
MLKIKILNRLVIIDILTILLIIAILVVPTNVLRVILGLPFILFFPGYALIETLFIGKDRNDRLERVALSFGMSIVITGLIGLALNYTPWGIKLVPILISIACFVLITSGIGLFRRFSLQQSYNLFTELPFKIPGWGGGFFNRVLTVILILAIAGSLGTLVIIQAFPKGGQYFTEFYILGPEGKAANYPFEFTMKNNQVLSVRYYTAGQPPPADHGQIILGIINHEQQLSSYNVAVTIDKKPVDINFAGARLSRLENIQLKPEEKWEQEIGFAPLHTGDHQEVEFLLFKNNSTVTDHSLHIWINVKGN